MCLNTGHGEHQRRGSGEPRGVPEGNTQIRYPESTLSATLQAPGQGLEGKSPAPSGAAGDLSRAVQLSSPSPTNEIKGGAQSGPLPEMLWRPFLRRAGCPQRGGTAGSILIRPRASDGLPWRPFLLRVRRSWAWRSPPMGGLAVAMSLCVLACCSPPPVAGRFRQHLVFTPQDLCPPIL